MATLPDQLRSVAFPQNQYYREEHPKTQIYLHHTAGADNGPGVFQWWASNQTRVATCVVIERDGDIIQGYSSRYWAYHLGVKSATFRARGLSYIPLDKISIGIELTSWGGLTKKRGKFYTWTGKEIPADQVITLDKKHRGHKHYHKYTQEQIKAVSQLLDLWEERYQIPCTYQDDIFDITERALKGEPGLYTHCSVREDKVDVYPDPDLIKMLQERS